MTSEDLQEMKWQRRESERDPQDRLFATQMLDIANTGYTNIQPRAFRMRFIDLVSGRSRQTLHAVVATTE